MSWEGALSSWKCILYYQEPATHRPFVPIVLMPAWEPFTLARSLQKMPFVLVMQHWQGMLELELRSGKLL